MKLLPFAYEAGKIVEALTSSRLEVSRNINIARRSLEIRLACGARGELGDYSRGARAGRS